MQFLQSLFRSLLVVVGLSLALAPAIATAQGDIRFNIDRFQVDGNSILSPAKVQELVAPFAGRGKIYGDIQKALERLEGEYRRLGYGTVQVYVPEQELSSGIVKILVTEAVIGKVVVEGAKFHDNKNIRHSLPQLKEGDAPNMLKLSENIQLANENPSKKIELTLGVGEEEDKVDAKLTIQDDSPQKGFVTIDNTGTKASGKHRINFSYQNANLGNSDQVLTMAYITALDQPSGVKVNVVSAGYRLPLYNLGDSMDLIYANSSTNTPANVIAPGGTLGINGKGQTIAVRYNHNFPRAGEYSSKLIFGLDYKYINATCTNNGSPVATFPGNSDSAFIASCVPYTTRPTSATYSGQWQRPGNAMDFNVGFLHHTFPMGAKHFYPSPTSSQSDRYSFINGRQTPDRFAAIRYGGSYMLSLPGDVLFRGAVTAQHADAPLPSGEQLGLAGSSAVRGFLERAVSTDRGHVANLELYSPEYAGKLGVRGSFKVLAFYDWASGQNITPSTSSYARSNIASVGIGLRYSLDKDISAKFDLVRVTEGHATSPTTGEAAKPGDIRGHFNLTYGF